jgi:hypothetical protein
VSTELAIGSYPEASQFSTFEVDYHIILILFSSTSPKGLVIHFFNCHIVLVISVVCHTVYCYFYLLYFITQAIIGTKQNCDAIYFLDSLIIHPSQLHIFSGAPCFLIS